MDEKQGVLLTAAEVGDRVRRTAKSVRRWVRDNRYNSEHGVYHLPGGQVMFDWPVFEEKVLKQRK